MVAQIDQQLTKKDIDNNSDKCVSFDEPGVVKPPAAGPYRVTDATDVDLIYYFSVFLCGSTPARQDVCQTCLGPVPFVDLACADTTYHL